jgi:hypothetical protein
MPNVLIEEGFRFYFFSNENQEPAHVHVTDEENIAKFWLNFSNNQVSLEYNEGFSRNQLRRIRAILDRRSGMMRREYDEYQERKRTRL